MAAARPNNRTFFIIFLKLFQKFLHLLLMKLRFIYTFPSNISGHYVAANILE